MKRLAILFIIGMIGAETLAQVELNMTQQYKSSSQQAILYEAVPQLRMADFEKMQTLYKPKILSASDIIFSNDTTWSYDELRRNGEKVYVPESYSQRYYKGNKTNFSIFEHGMSWNRDLAEWQQTYNQESWFNDSFNDSSKSYYFRAGSTTPRSGYKHVYTKNPPEGFESEEYYYEMRNDGSWQPIYISQVRDVNAIHNYHYRTFYFSETLNDYYLSSVMRSMWTDSSKMSENKQLDENGITYHSYFYEKLDEHDRTLYSVYYSYNEDKGGLVPEDSTHFYYAENTQTAITFEKDMTYEWKIQSFTRTYQSPANFNEFGFKTDSVYGYFASYDAEADSIIIGEILSKYYFQYDEEGILTEQIYYYRYDEGLVITFKMETDKFVEGEYNFKRENSYNRDYTSGKLILSSVYETGENAYGNKSINRYFNFAANGDTLNGSKDLLFTEEGGLVMYSMAYYWHKDINSFVLYYASVYTEKEPIATTSNIAKDGDDRRGIYATSALPGALTDGPLFIEMNDTLDFIISARNPDMSIPRVEVTNLPQTATYNPETRRFYWIVDDLNPTPMTYIAIRGTQSTQTMVKFVHGEITVPLERDNELPTQVQLYQNYPNPFNPHTNIQFEVNKQTAVHLVVFNILGQQVAELVNEVKNAGSYAVQFNAANLSSGMYMYQIKADQILLTKKMMLIK